MKKIVMLLEFVAAVSAAAYSSSNVSPFLTRFYQADPADISPTCIPINCNELPGIPCMVSFPGYKTYRSLEGQPPCAVQVVLRTQP